MLLIPALLSILLGQAAPPPVPGLCTAPVPADAETPGCYQTNTLDLTDAPRVLYWQIYAFPSLESAQAEAARHRWSAVAQAHGKTWLYLISDTDQTLEGVRAQAVIGPLTQPDGPTTAHFAEAIFPPGMRTRVHAHPGPEAFYVVEGEQCMDALSGHALVAAGETYVVASGPHVQAAPRGRRNLVLIIAPAGAPFVTPINDGWSPSDFCDG